MENSLVIFKDENITLENKGCRQQYRKEFSKILKLIFNIFQNDYHYVILCSFTELEYLKTVLEQFLVMLRPSQHFLLGTLRTGMTKSNLSSVTSDHFRKFYICMEYFEFSENSQL